MGTILASELIAQVGADLNDTSHVRWSESELLRFLSDGQRVISLAKPDVYTYLVSFPLVSGVKQLLPSSSHQLQYIVRNMGTDGQTPGRVISQIDLAALDLINPNWHAATPSSVVKHYAYNDRVPEIFWVYPPNDGTGWVEAAICVLPPKLSSTSETISLHDVYAPALHYYMLHRAYLRDAEHPNNAELANLYYNNFLRMLMLKEGRESAEYPVTGEAKNK